MLYTTARVEFARAIHERLDDPVPELHFWVGVSGRTSAGEAGGAHGDADGVEPGGFDVVHVRLVEPRLPGTSR